MSIQTTVKINEVVSGVPVTEVADLFLRRDYDNHWPSKVYSLTGGTSTEIQTGLTTISFLYICDLGSTTIRFYKKLSPEYFTFEDALLIVGCNLTGFALRAEADTTVRIFACGS